MLKDLDLISAVLVLLFASPLFIIVLSSPIEDWLKARQDRKKAARAAAEAAADGVESPIAKPA